MAAGRGSLSASRVLVVPRRPSRAVPFNEKEFFYRSRVLRRAQKQAAAADWTGRCPVLVSSEEVAALANRCQQLEWAAAVAHYNVTQLHERVSLLEAAGEMPLLPLHVASPEAQPAEHADQVMSAPASPESADDARREETVETEAARLVDPLEAVDEAETSAQKIAPKKKKKKRNASADSGAMAAVGAASPSKDPGTDESSSGPRKAKVRLGAGRLVSVPPRTGQWAVVQGLQNAKHTDYNEAIVRVGSQRDNGRFETSCLGTGVKLTVRPENLRGMLVSYDGYTAGDKVTYEDSELELLGFDFEAQRWACKQPKKQEDGSVQYCYLWVASLQNL